MIGKKIFYRGEKVNRTNKHISMAVVRRLPKYHRYLKDLLDKDVFRISSKELSDIIGFTASQIRQDLNNFGGFGQQGYGYNVEDLYEEIGKILGLDQDYNAIVIGAGNMGQALANYPWFQNEGFRIAAMFDANPKLIGTKFKDIDILDIAKLEEYINEKNVKIAVIATPKESAQGIVDVIAKTGIEGIWNFAPIDLDIPERIIVENAHLSDSLYVLSYMINEPNLFER